MFGRVVEIDRFGELKFHVKDASGNVQIMKVIGGGPLIYDKQVLKSGSGANFYATACALNAPVFSTEKEADDERKKGVNLRSTWGDDSDDDY